MKGLDIDLGLVANKATSTDSKLQQRFRRLLEKVDRLRQRVRAWTEARSAIQRELATFAVHDEAYAKLARAMVELLDRSSALLTKAERKRVAVLIADLAGGLIARGQHDDLKVIYERHSGSDFEAEVAAEDALQAEEMKATLEAMGVEFGDADVSTMEKLRAFAEQGPPPQEAPRATTRKRTAKQQAAEARRAEEHRDAHKAVQDVYRALAMAVHPDREQDPVERARKTELMREVNVAYEAKDLLRLLELQLQLERVDATRVDVIAEDRVRHYNRILDEQAKQLAVELDDLELPFRMQLGLSPTTRLTPSTVVHAILADRAELQDRTRLLARDLAAFEDVRALKTWLRR